MTEITCNLRFCPSRWRVFELDVDWFPKHWWQEATPGTNMGQKQNVVEQRLKVEDPGQNPRDMTLAGDDWQLTLIAHQRFCSWVGSFLKHTSEMWFWCSQGWPRAIQLIKLQATCTFMGFSQLLVNLHSLFQDSMCHLPQWILWWPWYNLKMNSLFKCYSGKM